MCVCVCLLTKKPVQLDHVQLEVMNEAIDIEEVAHQCHQAISYIQEVIQHFKLKNPHLIS